MENLDEYGQGLTSELPELNWNSSQCARLRECVVCGSSASAKHSSVVTCNACAAFFRRSVSWNRQYFCKRGKRCPIPGKLQKNKICKYCRFQKCVIVGMKLPDTVPALAEKRAAGTSSVETPIERLMRCRKANFVNRARAMASVYGGQKNLRCVSNLPMDSASVGKALRAEFFVIRDFLNASGILDYFASDDIDICHRLASSFVYTWMIYECTCNTIRNFGHHIRRFYFLNESYVDISETALEYYYSTDPNIFDRQHAARLGMDVYTEHLHVVRKLAQARLDDTEHAVLVVLLLLLSTREVLPTCSGVLAPLVNSAFFSLRQHCERTYEDVALRLDTILHLAYELQRIRRVFDEHVIILRLFGKQLVLSKIQDDIDTRDSGSRDR